MKSREKQLYDNLNDLLVHNVDAKYYMASEYLDICIRHRVRQEGDDCFLFLEDIPAL